MAQLKGTLHIHSTYSDGELKLIELREIFLSRGFRFACVTDHAESFYRRSWMPTLKNARHFPMSVSNLFPALSLNASRRCTFSAME